MAAQEGSQERKTKHTEDVAEESVPQLSDVDKDHKKSIDEDVDDILDEIDDVLETNAEDFIRGYVQKGGQ